MLGAAARRWRESSHYIEDRTLLSATLVAEDFQHDLPETIQVQSGQWQTAGGHLTATAAPGTEAISTLQLARLPGRAVQFGATLGEPPAGGQGDGILLFDDQGPADFKYAGQRQDQWIVGVRDGRGWHDLDGVASHGGAE